MQQLVTNTDAVVESSDVDASKVERIANQAAVDAGRASASALYSGVQAHAQAVLCYLQSVCVIADDDERDAADGLDFGPAFKAEYAARVGKGIKDGGIAAASKALSRVRASARGVIGGTGSLADRLKTHSQGHWRLIESAADLVELGTQTDADNAAHQKAAQAAKAGSGKKGGAIPSSSADPADGENADKPISKSQRHMICAAYESFLQALAECNLEFDSTGVKHRFEATSAALQSEMRKLGWPNNLE